MWRVRGIWNRIAAPSRCIRENLFLQVSVLCYFLFIGDAGINRKYHCMNEFIDVPNSLLSMINENFDFFFTIFYFSTDNNCCPRLNNLAFISEQSSNYI